MSDNRKARPKVKDDRVPKTIRLSKIGVSEVQRWADHYGVDWSTAARRMLKVASTKMPDTWPEEW